MLLEFKSQAQFLESFANGALKGALPAEKIDTNTLEYPVKVEFDLDTKTFKLYVEPEVIKPAEAPKKAKKKLSKGAIAGIVIGCIALVALIVGLAVGLSGCSTKTAKCAERDQHGTCITEELTFQKRR